MKLLLLLSLIMLASGDGALVGEKTIENDDIPLQASPILQAQPNLVQEVLGERRLGKRSVLAPATYVDAYTAPVLPLRLGGLSSYGLSGGYGLSGYGLNGYGLSSYGLSGYGLYPSLSLRTGGFYKGW